MFCTPLVGGGNWVEMILVVQVCAVSGYFPLSKDMHVRCGCVSNWKLQCVPRFPPNVGWDKLLPTMTLSMISGNRLWDEMSYNIALKEPVLIRFNQKSSVWWCIFLCVCGIELPAEDRERWENFISGLLADTNKRNTVDLVSKCMNINTELEFLLS